MLLKVTVNGDVYEVEVEVEEDPRPPIGPLFVGGGFVPQHAVAPAATQRSSDGQGVKAPLGGTVIRVPVTEGQDVAPGDVLVVLEAMKMETEITATAAGKVRAVLVGVGDAVTGGQVVVQVEAAA